MAYLSAIEMKGWHATAASGLPALQPGTETRPDLDQRGQAGFRGLNGPCLSRAPLDTAVNRSQLAAMAQSEPVGGGRRRGH